MALLAEEWGLPQHRLDAGLLPCADGESRVRPLLLTLPLPWPPAALHFSL